MNPFLKTRHASVYLGDSAFNCGLRGILAGLPGVHAKVHLAGGTVAVETSANEAPSGITADHATGQ